MSTRERWIVYPLLFFAFCLAVKGQPNLVQDGRFKSISCEELTVKLPSGEARVHIGSTSQRSGRVSIYGRQGQPAVVLGVARQGENGSVETLDANGRRTVRLGTTVECDHLVVTSPEGAARLLLGVAANRSGMISILGDSGKKAIVLTAGPSGEGVLETFNGRDGQAVGIGATADGGLLQLRHADGKRLLLLRFGKESTPWGLFSLHSDGRTRPLAVEATLTDTNLDPLDDPDQDSNGAAEQPEEETQRDETDSTPDESTDPADDAAEEPAGQEEAR